MEEVKYYNILEVSNYLETIKDLLTNEVFQADLLILNLLSHMKRYYISSDLVHEYFETQRMLEEKVIKVLSI